jgi:hypothetical protein
LMRNFQWPESRCQSHSVNPRRLPSCQLARLA